MTAHIGTKTGYGVLTRNPGIPPKQRDEMLLRDKAMSGDMVLSASSTAFAKAATTATGTWSKALTWKIKTAAGDLHDWFCGWMKCTIKNPSTTAKVSILGGLPTSVYFNGGVTVINLTSTTGPCVAGTTCAIRIWRENLLGNPVSTVSAVGTFS